MAGRDAVEGIRRFEIDRLSTMFGLVTSAIFHLLLIGSNYLVEPTVEIQDSTIVCWFPPLPPITLEPDPFDPSVLRSGVGYLPRISPVGTHVPVADSQAIIQDMLDELARRWEDFPTFSGPVNESQSGFGGTDDAGSEPGLTEIVDAEPPEFIPGIEKFPQPIKKVTPEYPEIARLAGLEGKVYLKMLITKEGKVKKASVIKSDHEVFEMMALQAALQWTFTPGMVSAGPVAVWVKLPFEFKLNK